MKVVPCHFVSCKHFKEYELIEGLAIPAACQFCSRASKTDCYEQKDQKES